VAPGGRMRRMKDHQLKAWLRLADTGSIRAAARSLHLSQAAVTKAIRELEAEVDAQLVLRSSRGIEFTECGRQLTVRARLAHQQLELARQDIRILQGSQHGRVSIAVTPMVFLGVLPEVVRAFRKAMPHAQLKLFDGLIPQVLPLLREGTIDFAVAGPVAAALDADFAFERLDMIEMAVLCRRGHPLNRATRWEEVAGAEWLMHLAPGSQHTFLLEQYAAQGLPLPEHRIEVASFGVSWGLLTRSDALMVGPAGMLTMPPYADLVERVPLAMPVPPLELGIVSPRGKPLSLAALRLAELFRKYLARPA